MDKFRDVYAVIVAGGSGTRFGGNLPKQFELLGGISVLMRSVMTFRKLLPLENVVIVLGDGMESYWVDECERLGIERGETVTGGATRWHSARNGVMALPVQRNNDVILIHDAARPFVTEAIVSRVVDAVGNGKDCAIPVTEVTDSIRRLDDDGCSVALDRSLLRAVQTPQGFNAGKLKRAFEMPYSPLFTDEASMMEAAGYKDIALVEGSPDNFKITRRADLVLAELIIEGNARS